MIEKHMRLVLKRKLMSWASSVDDEIIKKIILKKTIITGGAIVSMIQNETPKDFDVYFEDYESCLKVANYYKDKFNKKVCTKEVSVITSDGIEAALASCPTDDSDRIESLEGIRRQLNFNEEDGERVYLWVQSTGLAKAEKDTVDEDATFEDVYDSSHVDEAPEEVDRYVVKYISCNAITLSDKLQIIVRFYGDPEKIHTTFDFIHTKAYYTAKDNTLVIPVEVYEAVANHVLLYTGSRYPIASVIRSRKFLKRGWTINAGQYLKMCYQISHLDLDDINVLQDQLVGVDSAFFMNLIDALHSNKENWGYDYLSTLIDRIF